MMTDQGLCQFKAESALSALALAAERARVVVAAGVPADLAGLYGLQAAMLIVGRHAEGLEDALTALDDVIWDAIKAQGGLTGGEDDSRIAAD